MSRQFFLIKSSGQKVITNLISTKIYGLTAIRKNCFENALTTQAEIPKS